MTPNRVAAFLAALVFGVVGIWGLAATASAADPASGVLLAGTLSTSVPVALGHTVAALILVVGAIINDRIARVVVVGIGVGCLVVGLVGLFRAGNPDSILQINGATNLLHMVAASALLAVGLGVAPRTVSTPRREPLS